MRPASRTNPIHLLVAPDRHTGYGSFSFHLTDHLLRLGLPLRVHIANDFRPPESWAGSLARDTAAPLMWTMVVGPPDRIPIDPARPTVAFTMWESGRLDPAAAKSLSRAKLVAVPNEWSITTFDAAGVDAPMRLVRLGYDPAAFRDTGAAPNSCTFGTAASLTLGGIRKNVGQVVEAFRLAFPTERDVRLRIKLTEACPADAVRTPDRRVEILRVRMTDQALNEWYNSLSAFVTTSFAEGWGQHNVEAMGCGRPVIGTRFGGQAEYLNDAVGYCVGYDLRPANLGSYRGLWGVPNTDSVAAAMRAVYERPAEAAAKGSAAKQAVAGLTWEATARRLMEVLRAEGVWDGDDSPERPLQRPVTVAFLAWNGLPHTRRMLEAARRTLPAGAELLAVDNGSTDGTAEFLAAEGVRTIRNAENRGFTAAANQALAATDNDTVLLNNDCVPDSAGWVQGLQEAAGPNIGLVGCRHLDGRGGVGHTGGRVLPLTLEGHDISYPTDLGQGLGLSDPQYVSFACVYVPRGTVERVGLLDERYFAYYEDTDYCLRVREAGLRVVCDGRVSVTHIGNATSSSLPGGTSEILSKSRAHFAAKWGARLLGGRPRINWKVDCVGDEAQRHLRDLLVALHDAGAAQLVSLRCDWGPLRADPVVSRMAVDEVPPGGIQVVYGRPACWHANTGDTRIGFLAEPAEPTPTAAGHCHEVWRWGADVPAAADPALYHPGSAADPLAPGKCVLACPAGPWEDERLADLAAAVARDGWEVAVHPYRGMRPVPGTKPITKAVPWWAMGCLCRSAQAVADLGSPFAAVEAAAVGAALFTNEGGLWRQRVSPAPPTTWAEAAAAVVSRLKD